mmetsp:Transcript_38359/g.98067  ORF Transcript_38359/g.98067 Transcript_38359/m.98067 type:complete len:282 (+) Transcript_38359:180-1025(+)
MVTSRTAAAYLAGLIVVACAVGVGGRRLSQTPPQQGGLSTERASGGTKSVKANFANTYAGEGGNSVDQVIDLVMPDPEQAKPPVEWVRDVIPQRINPNKPQCAIGDPETYDFEEATTAPVGNTALTKVQIYVPPESDIRPEIRVKLNQTRKDGVVEVTGPGVYGVIRVDDKSPEKWLCGQWAWSHFGYYAFELKVLDATVTVEYYKRDHIPSRSASFEEFPLTFNLTVHTTVAGNGVNVLTDTSLLSKQGAGKIDVTLDNTILGNSNTISQTSRARVDNDN